jgi:beta-1,4-N-acetylglucosaminyltransferase
MSKQNKIAFVTVGSTRFDALVIRVLSEEVVEVLKENGITTLIVQAGNSTFNPPSSFEQDVGLLRGQIHDLPVELWTYKPSLKADYERAALIIGHAGIYSALRPYYSFGIDI